MVEIVAGGMPSTTGMRPLPEVEPISDIFLAFGWAAEEDRGITFERKRRCVYRAG